MIFMVKTPPARNKCGVPQKILECYKVLYVYMFLRSKPKNYLIIFIFYGIL